MIGDVLTCCRENWMITNIRLGRVWQRWPCEGVLLGPDFNQPKFWFPLFGVKLVFRGATDSLLLNMSGLGELPTNESLFSSAVFLVNRWENFPNGKAIFGSCFWFFSCHFLVWKSGLLNHSLSLNVFCRSFQTYRGCWLLCRLGKSLHDGTLISSHLKKSRVVP